MALTKRQIEEVVAKVTSDLVRRLNEDTAKRKEASDRLAKAASTATYAAGLRSKATAVGRAPGGGFEARHLRVAADMAEADARNPFASGVAPETSSGQSSAAQYAAQLRAAAAESEASNNPISARWLRASAVQAEKEAANVATMTQAMSAPPKRVTSDEWMGREAVSSEVAKKKVEAAQAELDNALRAGESPAVLARLRTALAAAQLAESYALN
jgi:hypothetical protein